MRFNVPIERVDCSLYLLHFAAVEVVRVADCRVLTDGKATVTSVAKQITIQQTANVVESTNGPDVRLIRRIYEVAKVSRFVVMWISKLGPIDHVELEMAMKVTQAKDKHSVPALCDHDAAARPKMPESLVDPGKCSNNSVRCG
jgi:hypothetical protein